MVRVLKTSVVDYMVVPAFPKLFPFNVDSTVIRRTCDAEIKRHLHTAALHINYVNKLCFVPQQRRVEEKNQKKINILWITIRSYWSGYCLHYILQDDLTSILLHFEGYVKIKGILEILVQEDVLSTHSSREEETLCPAHRLVGSNAAQM